MSESKTMTSFDLACEFKVPSYYHPTIASNKACFDDKMVKTIQEYVIHNSLIGRRPRKDKNITIMNGLYSGTVRFQKFLGDLSDTLVKEFPTSDSDARGFIKDPFIPGSFHNVRTIAGYGMNPSGVPLPSKFADNSKKVDELDRYLTKIVGGLMLKFTEHTPLAINRLSNSGFPHFTFDPLVKVGAIRNIFENYDKFIDLVAEKRYGQLFSSFSAAPVITKTSRSQTDKILFENGKFVAKERKVFNFFGNEVVADKTIDGLAQEFFRTREREAFAYPILMNAPYQAVMQSARDYYSTEYSYIFKHISGDAIADKLKDYDKIIGIDVKQFDQSISRELMVIALRASNFPEAVTQGMVNMLSLPFIYENDEIGEKGSLFLNIEDHEMGLASGMFDVSDIGKIMGVVGMLKVLIKSKFIHLTLNEQDDTAQIDMFMKGKLPSCGGLNAGDDAILMMRGNPRAVRRVEEIIDDDPFLELESPISFLGHIFSMSSSGIVSAYPNANSFVENWWIPEHSYGSKHRFYAPFGWFDRKEYFSKHPYFSELNKIVNSTYKRHFHSNVDDNAQVDGMKMRNPPEFENAVDKLFMLKPEIIHHRFSVHDLSPEVLNRYFINFNVDYMNKHLKIKVK